MQLDFVKYLLLISVFSIKENKYCIDYRPHMYVVTDTTSRTLLLLASYVLMTYAMQILLYKF
jgi:hypothetical protein